MIPQRAPDWSFRINEITPRPTARHRSTSTGRAYTPENTRTYMTRIREAAAVAWGDREPVGCALAARITATFPRPKSGVNKTALYHTSKPDADNVLKAILDSITPVEVKGFVVSRGVMLDDKQACFVECHKRWADVGAQGDILAEFWWLDAH